MLKQITIRTTHDASELVADILYNITDQGVNIYDKQDLIDLISKEDFWDYVDDEAFNMTDFVQVKGYVTIKDCDTKLQELSSALEELKKNSFVETGSLEIVVED